MRSGASSPGAGACPADFASSAPMDRPSSDRRLVLAVFVVAALVLAPGAWFGFPSSKAVAGALRVLDGDVPYRDFWTMYAPGQFYAIAGLYRAFGAELLVQGLATVLVLAATAAGLCRLLRRLGATRVAAGLVAALFVGASWETGPELDSYPPALAFIVLGLSFVEAHVRSGRARSAFAAGLAYGCAACFKHDVGAYACFATGGGLLFAAAFARDGAERPPALRSVAWIALGSAAIVLPVAGILAWVAGRAAWEDLIVFPATDFRAVRGEAWPGLWPNLEPVRAWLVDPAELRLLKAAAVAPSRWLLAHLPEVGFLFGGAVWLVRRRSARATTVALGAIALVALPLYWWAAHTQPNTHLVSMAVFVALLVGPLVATLPRAGRIAVLVLALGYAVGFLPRPAESMLRTLVGGPRVVLDHPGVRGIRVSPREARYFGRIAEFVDANVAPDEPIYCGVARHDLPVIGNVRFHVLTGRPFAVRHHEIHPGITDHEAVQRETIAALEREGVRCLVIWRFGGDDPAWSAAQLEERRDARRALRPEWGADELDRWIERHYRVAFEIDEYRILWPRAAADPILPAAMRERGE